MKENKILSSFYSFSKKDFEFELYYQFPKNISFQVFDIAYEYLQHNDTVDIIELTTITRKENRNQGYGSEVINKFCKNFDNHIIVASAEMSSEHSMRSLTDSEYEEIFDKFNRFYIKNNFKDCTGIFNTYDKYTKRTYIYLNLIGKELIKIMENKSTNEILYNISEE